MLGALRFWAVLAICGLAVTLFSRPAGALENSELEERSVTRVLGPHPDRDEAPQGKVIESVEIARLPVFDEDDPVPDFVNIFHAQSRDPVIRRELLFKAGDIYQSERVAETIRNLQLLPQFGVVVVVPLKSKNPGYVRVLVIVRDVWSLRLAYELRGTFQSINYLLINPSEWNLLGTRTLLGGVFTLQPDRYSIGGQLIHPRIAGSKVDAQAMVSVYTNLDTGKTEGSVGNVALYRDLVSLADRWAFLVGSAWLVEQTRLYSDRRLLESAQGVPLVYHTSVARGGAQVTRSFGEQQKYDLTWGMEMIRRNFQATRGPDTSEGAFNAFVREEVPVSDTRVSPFFQLQHRTARYLATRDVETVSLQESFALGEVAALRVYPAARQFGSSRDLLGSVAWLGYTWPWNGGLVRVMANSSIEEADAARHQASAQGALRVVSPRVGFARVIFDSAVLSTYQNYLNRKIVLGGDSRPRGYVSAYFRGASGFVGTVELRTSAVNVLSARVGGVAFYDWGGTGDALKDVTLHQSLGAGVRILFPQLNRQVFRLDWAAPLTAGRGRIPDRPLPGGVYFTFGQAFDMPKVKLPEMLGGDTSLLELVH